MALSNFLFTVVGVGAVWLLVRSDLRSSSAVLSRNIRHVRSWLEKEAAASSAAAEKEYETFYSRHGFLVVFYVDIRIRAYESGFRVLD